MYSNFFKIIYAYNWEKKNIKTCYYKYQNNDFKIFLIYLLHCTVNALSRKRFILTVLVAGLAKRFSFGENNGNNEVLKRGDEEECGIHIVHDIFFFGLGGVSHVMRSRAVVDTVNYRTSK